MIYVVQFPGFVKVGFTAQTWEMRAARGFWSNKHPTELCGKLDDFNIISAFEGSMELEQIIHNDLLSGGIGEFYEESTTDDILTLLRSICPEIPVQKAIRTLPKQLRECCRGSPWKCGRCKKTFSRKDKMMNHIKRCKKE